MLKKEDIRIRDPYVLVDQENKQYYLYGTTGLTEGYKTVNYFVTYKSTDLENFSDPIVVFKGDNFWSDSDYWAPEVVFYNGKYYMLASFKSATRSRGTQILVSDSPEGPFKPLSEYPVTPEGWECLDGTLYFEDGKPYMVFCREWTQVRDGEMYAMELSPDLTHAVGEPIFLFSASQNKYVQPFKDGAGNDCYVTDGPCLYRENGKLVMLWSSTRESVYCVLKAYADSITGEWKHEDRPIFSVGGGHCMVFNAFDGRKMLSLHYPNESPKERAVFLDFCL